MVPELPQIIQECRTRRQLVQGPHIEAFEEEFARLLGSGHVRTCSTEYGRMALYFILKAMESAARHPRSSFPALTFWVVPEITRVAGFTPVFADIDPATFTLSPAARRARDHAAAPAPCCRRTSTGWRATWIRFSRSRERHNLKVIEDCAHSLGATYKGRMVGTLGDASFFSFQAFKPLNTYGGGLAWMRDADLARRVGEFAEAEQWPSEKRVESILRQRQVAAHVHPAEGVHLLAVPDLVCRVVDECKAGGAALGEACARSTRCPSIIAAGSRTCRRRSGWPGWSGCRSSSSARGVTRGMLDDLLGDVPGITIPHTPEGRTHVYYQYCAYVPDSRDHREAVHPPRRGRGADARGRLHADGVVRLGRRGGAAARSKAATAVQVPVYESLSDAEVERVGRLVREQVKRLRRTDARRGDRVTLPPALAAKRPSGAEVPAAGASASMSGR